VSGTGKPPAQGRKACAYEGVSCGSCALPCLLWPTTASSMLRCHVPFAAPARFEVVPCLGARGVCPMQRPVCCAVPLGCLWVGLRSWVMNARGRPAARPGIVATLTALWVGLRSLVMNASGSPVHAPCSFSDPHLLSDALQCGGPCSLGAAPAVMPVTP